MAPVDICNMALSHLKIGKSIANLSTDQTAEAQACNLFYPTTKLAVLRDFKWPFANSIGFLAEIEEDPFPDVNSNAEWAYAYQYPADAVNFHRIISGIRNDARQTRIPYRIFNGPAGKMILTDMDSAQGEWTSGAVTEANFDPDFVLALSFRLAVYVAPRLTGGDPFKLGESCMSSYMTEIRRALANSFNEQQPEEEPESEFIRARDGYFTNNNGGRGGAFGI